MSKKNDDLIEEDQTLEFSDSPSFREVRFSPPTLLRVSELPFPLELYTTHDLSGLFFRSFAEKKLGGCFCASELLMMEKEKEMENKI